MRDGRGDGGARGGGRTDDRLSFTFAALADPTRRAILDRLAGGEATVSQLAEPFAITQQAISKHLKVLERAGLISRSRTAQSRPCRLEPERLDTAAEWIGRHRQVWAERSDRLDDHLAVLGRREPERKAARQPEQRESGHERQRSRRDDLPADPRRRPRELLFDCMTQPEHLTHFWGPAGTTTPVGRIIVDLRPGGVFETAMVSDDAAAASTRCAPSTSRWTGPAGWCGPSPTSKAA